MDAHRFRFADHAAVLAERETVSNIIGPAHAADDEPAKSPDGGEMKPAA
jgi:hypothetical protein